MGRAQRGLDKSPQKGIRMSNRLAFALSAGLSFLTSTSICAQEPGITAEEARTIGVEAYVYFYPLISMDVSRRFFTNVEAGKEFGKAPMNTVANIPAYPPGDFKGVVRSNFDTLYSVVWLDLTKEPMVVSVPDTNGRFYLFPMLDMWTDVFASPGWRTTGTAAADYLVTPPGWTGAVPANMQQIPAPTPYVWVIGRTKTDGPQDYDAVHKIQAGYKVAPLSQFGKPAAPAKFEPDPTVDGKTPPKVQVDEMPADKYFAYAAELLKVNPPHDTDFSQIARLRRIGIIPGKSFDLSKADPVVQKALREAPAEAQQLMKWKLPTLARIANHWTINTDTVGVYGNYYLKRAIVAQVGLGANQPEDAIYPMNLGDGEGRPLSGEHRYVMHFDKHELPPVNAFWSVTLYDSEGFQVPNALNRFAVSSWMPFKYNNDGSLDLFFQNESPGKDLEQNWLPAPKGAFNLTLRLYAPKAEVLTGKWVPPAVNRIADTPSLGAQ